MLKDSVLGFSWLIGLLLVREYSFVQDQPDLLEKGQFLEKGKWFDVEKPVL